MKFLQDVEASSWVSVWV